MKNKFTCLFLLLVIFGSCGKKSENKKLTYQNIVILSDLSSRLDNKTNKDFEEIHQLIKYFKDNCVQPGKKIGDRSSIAFMSFLGNDISKIDLNEFETTSEKQQFVNSKGKFENNGLENRIKQFDESIRKTYTDVRNPGLDLISSLMEKIKNGKIIKKDTMLINGIDTTFIKYENQLYIFTDGYLEYYNKAVNNQFYFGKNEIQKVRDYSEQTKSNVSTVIEKNKELGLTPYEHPNNSSINLHVFETHERDKNDVLQTYKYVAGIRDNEILEAVWSDWARKSGFKSFEWKKY